MVLMAPITPQTPQELAEALAAAAAAGKTIALRGAGTKQRLTGSGRQAEVAISSLGLRRIVEYEPRDLTISVEAGMSFAKLAERIREDGLTLPLDPPFYDQATVGGVVAAGAAGPRRRFYGTVRDVVIGMKFTTLDGKVAQAGGMVVKNTAGFEMGKLMIGSLGTLAGIAVVNFRLAPRLPYSRSFLLRFGSLEEALIARDQLVAGVLQPLAIDLLNPAASTRIGQAGYLLVLRAGGNQSVIDRYSRELPDAEPVENEGEASLWKSIREFTPSFLAGAPAGGVVRVSSTIRGVGPVMERLADRSVVARAGTGVVYGYFDDCGAACRWVADAARAGLKCIVEYVAENGCEDVRWPVTGSDFVMMEQIKKMFDPRGLLNRGYLYGRL